MCFGKNRSSTQSNAVPPPTPPVTERSQEVRAASDQQRKDATRRNGYRRTFFGGEGKPKAENLGSKTLLGS
jgi:hypothetical protein